MNKKFKFRNLIIFLNDRCDVGCPSCNVAARLDNKGELTCEWLTIFFEKLAQIPFSGYIIWTGGEPFLSPDSLMKGIRLAAEKEYNSEVLTSGSWFEAYPEFLVKLKQAGNFSLRISLDAEHQQRIPVTKIISLVRSALDLKIELNFTIREIPGTRQEIRHYLAEIEAKSGFRITDQANSRRIHTIPHIPVTAEESYNKIFGSTGKNNWQARCQQGFKDIVIFKDGLLYPCCGLFGLKNSQQYALGDILTEQWQDLAADLFSKPLLKILYREGPFQLCRKLNLDPAAWRWPQFNNPCALCRALFSLRSEDVLKLTRKSLGSVVV